MEQENQKEIYLFGAMYVLEQVKLFEDEIDGTLTGEDIECVHRMRVTSRRLRTALRIFQNNLPDNFAYIWHKAFKSITHSLGNARDLDIQIQLIECKLLEETDQNFISGYRHLLFHLKQKRMKSQTKVNLAINDIQEENTLVQIKNSLQFSEDNKDFPCTPALFLHAFQAINSALNAFLSYKELIYSPDNGKDLHAMRIAGKHLRYTMEIFSSLFHDDLISYIEIMKGIQDLLGEIHDCDVWISWLPEFITQEQNRIQARFGPTSLINSLLPGLLYLIEDRKIARQKIYNDFIAVWEELSQEQTWGKIRDILKLFD